MALNRNNFLRFTGNFDPIESTLGGFGNNETIYANQDFIEFDPLAFCTASLGIDTNSFRITRIEAVSPYSGIISLTQECQWDGVSVLRVYRPVDLTVTEFYIYFTFADVLGNISTELATTMFCNPILVSWVIYPISAVCTLDAFGQNTGYLAGTQLVLVNPITTPPTEIVPLTLKANLISDPDYSPPIQNTVACPLPPDSSLTTSPLTIMNNTRNKSDPNNYIVITNIYFYNHNALFGSPLVLNINTNIAPGQSRTFQIPDGISYRVTLTYSVFGNMDTASPPRYWYFNVFGVTEDFPIPLTPNQVINAGVEDSGGENFFIFHPNGITLFAQ